MTNRRRAATAFVLSVLAASHLGAQAPDGNAMLRAAGVEVGRDGAEGAFDSGQTVSPPVPPSAFSSLIVGMGPIGPKTRVKNAYAFACWIAWPTSCAPTAVEATETRL